MGSPLRVFIDKDKITILPATEDKGAKRIKLTGDDVEKLVRDIIAYYIEGVEEVEIATRQVSSVVTKVEGKLPGVVLMPGLTRPYGRASRGLAPRWTGAPR